MLIEWNSFATIIFIGFFFFIRNSTISVSWHLSKLLCCRRRNSLDLSFDFDEPARFSHIFSWHRKIDVLSKYVSFSANLMFFLCLIAFERWNFEFSNVFTFVFIRWCYHQSCYEKCAPCDAIFNENNRKFWRQRNKGWSCESSPWAQVSCEIKTMKWITNIKIKTIRKLTLITYI